ncbi:MAG: HAMP domain-containing histidine kinase [Sphaerochaetaceae bacterium]|nr:HAMP domain-containing histidine kinase [Sphaerochaetaceae bacterium]
MTLVKKTFLVFSLSFLVQILLVGSLVSLGFQHSMGQWERIRQEESANLVREALEVSADDPVFIDAPWPIMIFDEHQELIGSSQNSRIMPMGRMGGRNPFGAKVAVYEGESLIGYYSVNIDEFKDDIANEALFASMLRISFVAFAVSLLISLLAAYLFSRSISGPADILSTHLRAMSDGNLDEEVTITGDAELVGIGSSVETLRKRMVHEQGLRAQWGQDIAHDLRTPVASVKSQVEGMEDGVLKPTPERFQMMMKELERMESLIGDLETLMKLESPEIFVDRQELVSEALLADLRDMFSSLLESRSMRFVTESSLKSFSGDEALITRALGNLVMNAILYGDPSGTITVIFDQEGDEIALRVNNTGHPIPSEERDRIFERLYRGEFARNTPGTGLGLTIVTQIASLHGGRVHLTSTASEGTTFSILLPATDR